MTYVIGQPCVAVTDRACVEQCPVDRIDEGARRLRVQAEPELCPAHIVPGVTE